MVVKLKLENMNVSPRMRRLKNSINMLLKHVLLLRKCVLKQQYVQYTFSNPSHYTRENENL